MVKGEPNTPTMVVKRDWKRNGYQKEHDQHELIISIYDREGSQVGKKYCQLSRDYIDQDGTDEKPLFALEDRPTRRAMAFYSKRRLNDGRLSAGWTPEQKTPAEEVCKRWVVSPH
jgi:hypothetical protein